MIKDCHGKTIEVGDRSVVLPGAGIFISAVIQEVTGPIMAPGIPMPVQKVRLLAIIELPPAPSGGQFTGIAITDKNDTAEAGKVLEQLKKLINEMRVGSGTSTLLAG